MNITKIALQLSKAVRSQKQRLIAHRKRDIRTLALLIDKEDFITARQLITHLEKQFPFNCDESSDLVRAESIMHFLEDD